MGTEKPFFYAAKNCWYIWTRTTDGKRRRVRLAETKTKAFDLWRKGVELGHRQMMGDCSMHDIGSQWIKRQNQRHKQGQVSTSWLTRVVATIDRFLRDHPHIAVSEVTPTCVQSWCRGSASYERTEIGTLKQCLRWAVNQGLVKSNPLAALVLPSTTRRNVVLLPSQHRQMVLSCGGSKYSGKSVRRFRAFLILLWHTGARPNELRLLEWSQINRDYTIATLTKHKTAKSTQRPRLVMFPPCAQTLLRILGRKDGPVLLNARGEAWTKDAVVRRLSRLRNDGQAVAYSYRHTFITRAMVSGVDVATVAQMTGTSIQMIDRHYGHLSTATSHLLAAARLVK